MLMLSLSRRSQKYELCVFEMPAKLFASNSEEEGLINNRELSMICGCSLDEQVLDCQFDPKDEDQVLVLTLNKVQVYQRKHSESDLLIKIKDISLDLVPSKLVLLDQGVLVIDHGGKNVQDLNKDSKISCDHKVLDIFQQENKTCFVTTNNVQVLDDQEGTLNKLPLPSVIKQASVNKSTIAVIDEEHNVYCSKIPNFNGKFEFTDINVKASNSSILNPSHVAIVKGKKIQIININDKEVKLEHEASKKATEITDVAIAEPNILCCSDDANSVHIFQCDF